jgi:hypothetical protein
MSIVQNPLFLKPALEDQLEEFVLEQRAACRGLNTVQLRMKVVELAKSNNIDNFKGNPSWCYRFNAFLDFFVIRRVSFCLRQPLITFSLTPYLRCAAILPPFSSA